MMLKPCPFCGGKGEAGTDSVMFYVVCTGCGSGVDQHSTSDEAIATWNTRADEARIRLETIEECVKACEAMDKDIVCPEECAAIISALAEEPDAD